MRTELAKEITIVLVIKLAVLLLIWRMFFYDNAPVIAPLENLLP